MSLYRSKKKMEGGIPVKIDGIPVSYSEVDIDKVITTPFTNFNPTTNYTNYASSPVYVVYNNTLHWFFKSGTYGGHYKLVDGVWVEASTLPVASSAAINKSSGGVVVYDGNIYILGCANYPQAYKWNGTTWTTAFTMPYSPLEIAYGVFNNKIYIVGGEEYTDTNKSYYTWNGTTLTKVSNGPELPRYGNQFLFADDSYLYCLGGDDEDHSVKGYRLASGGSTWSYWSSGNYSFNSHGAFFKIMKYDGKYYQFLDNDIYESSSLSFSSNNKIKQNLPYTLTDAIVYDNKIYLMTADFIIPIESSLYQIG